MMPLGLVDIELRIIAGVAKAHLEGQNDVLVKVKPILDRVDDGALSDALYENNELTVRRRPARDGLLACQINR